MPDQETIDVYNQRAEAYAELPIDELTLPALDSFLERLTPGGLVLDLGCGPAQTSARMLEKGFNVDAVDASTEMIRLAKSTYNVDVRQAGFDDIDADSTYAGIWASFSLLHADRDHFPSILASLHRALLPDGSFYLSMKLGNGASRDDLGRLYTYYTSEQLVDQLKNANFSILQKDTGEGMGLAGHVEKWVGFICQSA